jgi:hypothetical protein
MLVSTLGKLNSGANGIKGEPGIRLIGFSPAWLVVKNLRHHGLRLNIAQRLVSRLPIVPDFPTLAPWREPAVCMAQALAMLGFQPAMVAPLLRVRNKKII